MSDFVCITCESIVDIDGTLCDNSCGTFTCDVCLQEYYISDIVRPGHNPECGMFSSSDEDLNLYSSESESESESDSESF